MAPISKARISNPCRAKLILKAFMHFKCWYIYYYILPFVRGTARVLRQ